MCVFIFHTFIDVYKFERQTDLKFFISIYGLTCLNLNKVWLHWWNVKVSNWNIFFFESNPNKYYKNFFVFIIFRIEWAITCRIINQSTLYYKVVWETLSFSNWRDSSFRRCSSRRFKDGLFRENLSANC